MQTYQLSGDFGGPDDSCGIACYFAALWHIPGDEGCCADERVVANGCLSSDYGRGANEALGPNRRPSGQNNPRSERIKTSKCDIMSHDAGNVDIIEVAEVASRLYGTTLKHQISPSGISVKQLFPVDISIWMNKVWKSIDTCSDAFDDAF